VLAPEDTALDCGPWLLWIEPSGIHSAADRWPHSVDEELAAPLSR
jgi:hypothetical protein